MIVVLTVDVRHVSGRFVGFDEVSDALLSAVENADLSGLGDLSDSEYEVDNVGAESGANVRRAVRAVAARARAQGRNVTPR